MSRAPNNIHDIISLTGVGEEVEWTHRSGEQSGGYEGWWREFKFNFN